MFLTLDKIIGEITHKKGSDIKAAALGEPGKQTERIQISKQTNKILPFITDWDIHNFLLCKR